MTILTFKYYLILYLSLIFIYYIVNICQVNSLVYETDSDTCACVYLSYLNLCVSVFVSVHAFTLLNLLCVTTNWASDDIVNHSDYMASSNWMLLKGTHATASL